MAELTFIEKGTIEKLFQMESGYVLDFSDRTFHQFIGGVCSVDINAEKYKAGGTSKANRLRTFWRLESDLVVGKVVEQIALYWKGKVDLGDFPKTEGLDNYYRDVLRIAERLKQGQVVEVIEAITPLNDEKDFQMVVDSIKLSIERNEPEMALDRLHTYTIKFVRTLCQKHGIEYSLSEALNAIFGKYIKFIVSNGLVESQMSEKILRYSISILAAFNDVRNNKSLAHDNKVLNYDEAILIFNNIANSMRFIQKLEEGLTMEASVEDLPF